MVLKRDGRREEFSKEKLLLGIKKACQKRPISQKVIEDLVEKIVNKVTDGYEREVPAEELGRQVMQGLREIDQVAYVRFASVYRRFQEATDFVQEVRKLEGNHDCTRLGLPVVPVGQRGKRAALGGDGLGRVDGRHRGVV